MKTVKPGKTTCCLTLAGLILGAAVLACSSSPTSAPRENPITIPPSQTPRQAAAGCLEGVYPAMTTRDQVVALFGEPASAEPNDNQEILLYATNDRGQFHTIVLQDSVVGLVSVIVDEQSPLSWSSVKKQYGNPALTTYSHFLEGTRTYIYPEQGQSFVASPDLDVVFARECFRPMTADEFMKSWGSSLPLENPFNR